MRRNSWKRTLVCSLLLAACLYGSTRELRTLQIMRPTARIEEVLYISSPDFVRRMSLGYSGLAADIYWTRAARKYEVIMFLRRRSTATKQGSVASLSRILLSIPEMLFAMISSADDMS